jgi:hypothetical protein
MYKTWWTDNLPNTDTIISYDDNLEKVGKGHYDLIYKSWMKDTTDAREQSMYKPSRKLQFSSSTETIAKTYPVNELKTIINQIITHTTKNNSMHFNTESY